MRRGKDVIFGLNLSISRVNSNRKLIDLLQMCFTTELGTVIYSKPTTLQSNLANSNVHL